MSDDRFEFRELDADTRTHMLSELDHDIRVKEHPFYGVVLTERGRSDYVELLRAAIESGTEVDLVDSLSAHGRVTSTPKDSARRLGRTEFNRFYIRGICRRADAHGTTTVVVYRAHGSTNPRSSSQQLDGTKLHAPTILANLRGNDADPETGLGRANSGMTVRCGCDQCRQGDA